MLKIAMGLAFSVSAMLAGCASNAPAPEPMTDEVSADSLMCDVDVQCSTTGDEFFGSGTPGGALMQAMNACKPACHGGTCKVISNVCS